jgi:hypothetical protein
MADPLPRVLAGPIVRRVDSTGCSFWVATSVAGNVTARIWLNNQIAADMPATVVSGDSPVSSSPATELLQFGSNLYACVVTVPLGGANPPLTPGRIYSYDLVFTGMFGQTGLKQEKLLEDEQPGSRLDGVNASAPLHLALGYIPDRLPSFVSPPAVITPDGNLRIAHTSCRKSNGVGPDALAWLDDVIQQNYTDPDKRIQQLFLTGDQIYADDVGTCLLSMLNGLGRDLVGREEDVPVTDAISMPGTMPNFPSLRRARLVREIAKLSSGDCDNHLVTFPEYLSMYLAAWSPRVWRPLAQDGDLFSPPPVEADLAGTFTDWEQCYKSAGTPAQQTQKWQEERQPAVDAERLLVEEYRAAVPKVARALANTATYMILDDHEITDDWNLNKRWRNRVYSNKLGRAIVRNGLMAYTICQGWGNTPVDFGKADSPNKKLLDEIQKVLGIQPALPGVNLPVGNVDTLDRMLGLLDQPNSVKWHFTVPGPLHRINVLDTRTRRKFTGEGMAPPSLLGDSLNDQLPAGPFIDGRELLLIITPGPVLSPHIIESIGAAAFEIVGDFKYGIKKLASANPCQPGGPETGVEAADAESWSANPPAREELLKRLATYKQAVILSGDVHFAASLTLDYWTGTTPARIVQLIASSARNGFSPTVVAILKSDALLQRYEAGQNPELLGWDGESSIQLPAGAKIAPGRRARLHHSPSLVPAGGWPAGSSIPADAGKQPNWRWRLKLVRDERTDVQLPAEGPHPPPYGGPELDLGNAASVVPAYSAVAARHQTAALTGEVVALRQIVFTTNVGLVDISKSDGAYTVRHTLLSRSQNPPYQGIANTVHAISLAATAEPAPTLQTES